MSRIRVYSWYGYIGAPFPHGLGYSRGLDVLGDKLAALPGVTVAPTHANWLSQSKVAADARAHPSARKVCIGHSMGVYAITRLAARARDIAWDDYEEAIPAFVTMLVMPFTWSITNGIGAGFVTYTAIKALGGRRVHWLMVLASAAFVVYFALPLLERLGS